MNESASIRRPPGPLLTPPELRFEQLVERRGPDDCWPWRGRVDSGGRPRFRVKISGRWIDEYAYRCAWALSTGAAPEGDVVAVCGNRLCCNPAHLRDVPVRESRRANVLAFWREEAST